MQRLKIGIMALSKIMRLRIINISWVFGCLLCLFLWVVVPVHADGPVVQGRVITDGTNAPVAGIWVKWTENYGTQYEGSGYRYAQTDSNGYFSFPFWASVNQNQATNQPIDTNLDGKNDAYAAIVDLSRPTPWVPGGGTTLAEHFGCGEVPHAFTGVVPVAWAGGRFSVSAGVGFANVAGIVTVSDIIYTPAPPTPTPTPAPIYSVSGNVFIDANINGKKDAGEVNYSGKPVVTASRGTVTTSSGGLYTVSNLTAGPLTISFPNLPSGYSMTSPRNGPPPSFQVIVGPSCSTNSAPGASCQ